MPQTATIRSATLNALDVTPVMLDCQITPGLPRLTILGLGDATGAEATARVRCAIKASGFEMPQASITVQTHPSTVRIRGTATDLAIATAILAASKQIPPIPEDACLVGELTLRGDVIDVRGMQCYDRWCVDHDSTLVCAPTSSLMSHVPVDDLAELRTLDWVPATSSGMEPAPHTPETLSEPLRDAFQSAMSENRLILLRGADGPVSHAVRALWSSLPQLTSDQCAELARISSACRESFAGEPPFRAPHHSISCAGLVGGGRPVVPGELTLATHGLMLISDAERWSQSQLDVMTLPLQEREVRIVRVEGAWTMPASPALMVVSTTDVKTPAPQLLRGLGRLGYVEVML